VANEQGEYEVDEEREKRGDIDSAASLICACGCFMCMVIAGEQKRFRKCSGAADSKGRFGDDGVD
jgi:hypothetical protein